MIAGSIQRLKLCRHYGIYLLSDLLRPALRVIHYWHGQMSRLTPQQSMGGCVSSVTPSLQVMAGCKRES